MDSVHGTLLLGASWCGVWEVDFSIVLDVSNALLQIYLTRQFLMLYKFSGANVYSSMSERTSWVAFSVLSWCVPKCCCVP